MLYPLVSSFGVATGLAMAGLVAVAVLVVLAYRGWVREIRFRLSHWRNGIGLSAFVLSSLAWLWFAQWWMLTLAGHSPSHPTYQFHLTALAALCAVLSLLLATALKGAPRLETIAAAVLLVAACKPFFYV